MPCKNKSTICRLLVIMFCVMSFNGLQAQTYRTEPPMRFGFHGGLYFDHTDFFIGANLRHTLRENIFLSAPNFDYVFTDGGSFISVNVDAHYVFPLESRSFWVGSGIGIGRLSPGNSGNTDLLFNFISGIDFGSGPLTPFLRIKAVLFDDSQLVVGGGVSF